MSSSGLLKLHLDNEKISVEPAIRPDDESPPKNVVPRQRIIILGAGGHARVIADALLIRAAKRPRMELVGFLDDDPNLLNTTALGKTVLGSLSDLGSIPHDAVVLGIGDNEIRCRLFQELSSRGEVFATIKHPRACIARDVKMGRGTVAFAGVVVNTGATIGNNVILNTGCTVGHDCTVATHSQIGPGAHLGGTVQVGEGAFLGIGSSTIQNVNIGDWSIVGGGSAVIRDVPPRTTVVGVPARALPPGGTKHKPDNRDLFPGEKEPGWSDTNFGREVSLEKIKRDK